MWLSWDLALGSSPLTGGGISAPAIKTRADRITKSSPAVGRFLSLLFGGAGWREKRDPISGGALEPSQTPAERQFFIRVFEPQQWPPFLEGCREFAPGRLSVLTMRSGRRGGDGGSCCCRSGRDKALAVSAGRRPGTRAHSRPSTGDAGKTPACGGDNRLAHCAP